MNEPGHGMAKLSSALDALEKKAPPPPLAGKYPSVPPPAAVKPPAEPQVPAANDVTVVGSYGIPSVGRFLEIKDERPGAAEPDITLALTLVGSNGNYNLLKWKRSHSTQDADKEPWIDYQGEKIILSPAEMEKLLKGEATPAPIIDALKLPAKTHQPPAEKPLAAPPTTKPPSGTLEVLSYGPQDNGIEVYLRHRSNTSASSEK
jgi:hypothetical protein